MPRCSTRLVRKAQRELLEPAIIELGFAGRYPQFIRDLGGERHFILFAARKYGGGFSIHGAWSPLTADHGDLAQTDFDQRATLQHLAEVCSVDGRMALRSLGDFDYEFIADDSEACRALANEALQILPQLDHWLRTREPGFAIDCKGHRLRSVHSPQLLWHMAAGAAGSFDIARQRPLTPHLDGQRQAELRDYYVDPD